MPDIEVAGAAEPEHAWSSATGPCAAPTTSAGSTCMIRSELYRRGNGMVAATKVDGSTWLKFTLLNPRAHVADIVAILDDIREIGASWRPSASEVA